MRDSGQYITYEQYRCMGGTLDKTPFNILEFKARKIIDERTQNRLCGIVDIPQELKMCMFEIMNILEEYKNATSQSNSIASESIDGYSVTYATADVNSKSVVEENIEDVMMTYLNNVRVNNVPVLYLGVC